jgi:NAD(P)-dependent dehydrogenase (short-subunit alcohol dehydrogenase family)
MNELTAADLFDLTGKVAVVTGGAGGIGTVYGRALAGAGATVVLADLDGDAAEREAMKLSADGPGADSGARFDALGVQLDVTSPSSAAAVAEAVTARFGGIDILVNNAAIMTELPKGRLVDLSVDDWDLVMRVNVMGTIVCARAVLESMIDRGGGRIINGSSAGGFNRGGIYGVSKYALHSVTTNLAGELAPLGINVNAIAPGLVENESGFIALPADSSMRAALKSIIPGKKSAPPTDLVGTLLLLCSKAGDWINGQTISVDGGWVMRL